MDGVPDTPVSDKKVVHSTPPAAEHETVATVPLDRVAPSTLTPSQRLTQPTQLLGAPPAAADHSVVQVAASSPPAPFSSPFRPAHGGVLSSSIAPSGTRFCPPAAGPAKRAPVINLDDGPTYGGGSSDDDIQLFENTDIKPAMFTKGSRSPEKVADSPSAGDRQLNRFKQVTSSAVYNPDAKRPASQMDPAPRGIPTKRPRQDVTSRDTALHDIADWSLRRKVERVQNVMPQKSVQQCLDALSVKNGNFDDAMDHLASLDEQNVSSEDELSIPRKTSPAPAAKQNIKARGTIQDKWSSMHVPSQKPSEQAQPRRRLMKGPKHRAASPSPVRETPKTGGLVKGRKHLSRSPTPEAEETPDEDSDEDVEEQTNSLTEVKLLSYLNSCGPRELADLAAETEELASHVLSYRPFESLDAVRVIPEAKKPNPKARKAPRPVGDKIVDKCLEMLTGLEAVDTLVAECEALGKPVATEMKKWGVDIFGKRGELELTSFEHDSGIGTPSSQQTSQPDEDSDSAPISGSRKTRFIPPPSIMCQELQMKDFQIVGINWLALLFEKELSCILADDMGLGKTCQVIAFLAHLYEKNIKGPHLVVVPSSTIENWLREFQKFCPTLNVMPYYAGQTERAHIRAMIEEDREEINVVITTYTIAKAKVDARFLREMDFCVCVYDEGHMLKSSKSVLYEKLIKIPARFRLLLTGTPLQNNLQELASLLGFILPGVFEQRKDDLQHIFSNKAKTSDESHSTLLSAQRIERAKSMLRPFVLRRKKGQVIDLPAKHSHVEYCDLSESQKAIYDHEQDQVRQLLEDRRAGKRTGNKTANILMTLRQAAIHPLLHRRHYTDDTLRRISKACLKEPTFAESNPDIIFEDLLVYNDLECHNLCKKYPKALGRFTLPDSAWMDSGKVTQLCALLSRFKANGDRTLVFSQFTKVMDILEHVLENEHTDFVRLDGATSVEDRQSILDAFHERTSIPVFLLSTKAGGAGINLACANKVVIFDSSFNPQEDVQAENRAHRVGQTRDVEVIRLVTRDTIEEQIHALGQTKLKLDQAVVGEDAVEVKRGEEAGIRAVEEMVAADFERKGEGEDGEKEGSA